MQFVDKDGRRVDLDYRSACDVADGDHVLALAIYKEQWLFTKHALRGIEFPGGKKEAGERSYDALCRELYEETGGTIQQAYYIAQYEVHTGMNQSFKKDVYVVIVDAIHKRDDYLETLGPISFKRIADIPQEEQSYLLQDTTIVQCLERVYELGFYKS